MVENTKLTSDIVASDEEAKYDAQCKLLLSEKVILSRIMQGCMKEYENCTPEEIAEKYIEGTPLISQFSLHPNGDAIRGLNTEDKSLSEGNIYYDIRFSAIVPNSNEPLQMIVNIEAQNNFYPSYPLIKRAVYYCARMISSQYGTEFSGENYGALKKVYSIGICTNPPKKLNNTIMRYSLQKEIVAGNCEDDGDNNFDLVSVVFVCLDKNGGGKSKVLQLLNLLLLEDCDALDKCKKLESDFGIPMTRKLSKEVDYMCNLSSGVLQRGYEKGFNSGISQGLSKGLETALRNLIKNTGFSIDYGMAALGIPLSEKKQSMNV